MFRLKSHAAMFALVIGLLATFNQTARAESWSWENLFSSGSSENAAAVCTTNPVVVNVLDSGAGSIRQAVIDACAGSTITFSASMPPEVSLTSGQIVIDKNMTIAGPGANLLIVRNGASSRIFGVNNGVTATISGLTIADGTNGGINNAGTLTVADCVIRSNKGSGVGNGGNLTVVNSVLSDNESGAGGAIYNTGTAAITNSNILHNSAGTGGGIYNDGSSSSVTITNSSITGNIATGDRGSFLINAGVYAPVWGSAIANLNGRVTITNSTIAGNEDQGFADEYCYYIPTTGSNPNGCAPGYGSAILLLIYNPNGQPFPDAEVNLINSTVTDNILVSILINTTIRPVITARNSIINGFTGGELTSLGYNLIVNAAGRTITGDTTGNILGVNPQLSPLGYYGGSTMTRPLLTGSPAINAGNTATSPAADQRGAARVGAADIGAFELNNSTNGGNFVVPLPDAFTEIAYSQLLVENTTINVTSLPFTYSLTGGALPTGISLSTTESRRVLVSGRTAQTGVFAFSVTATDGTNSFVTNYSIRVLASGAPPVTGCLSNPVVANRSDAGEGTLRQAVIDACAGGTISFGEAARGKIHLTTGPVVINKNLTIAGPGADALTLRSAVGSGHQNNVVLVKLGVTAVISGLTVSDGFADFGGGIINSGNLTVRNVVLSNNRGIAEGGAIGNYGTLTLDRSLVTGNGRPEVYARDRRSYDTNGGGIYSYYAASLTITDSTVSGNYATSGGGIYVASAAITNSTIGDNEISSAVVDSFGGGLYLDGGMMTLTNCTVSQNEVVRGVNGGGIHNNGGTLTLINSTVASNKLGDPNRINYGSGISNSFGTVNARNSIIAGNIIYGTTSLLSQQFDGELTSQGYNLIGNNRGAQIIGVTTGNIVGTQAAPIDARLSPLGYYGGPTQTHALLTGSPAINTGNTATSPAFDQRGAARVGTADIGAFELNNSSNGGAFVAQLPDGFVQKPYSYTVADFSTYDGLLGEIRNGYKYTYTVTGGALPNGISLSTTFSGSGYTERENVKVSGTPTVNGIFDFSVTATNNLGYTNVTNYRLVTGDSNPTPTPTPTATPTMTITPTPTPTMTPTPSPTPTPNTPPNAAADVSSVNEDTTLNINAPGVLGNDTDGENNSLTAVVQTSPANAASFTLNADGSFSYTPNPNFNGTDSFTYKANDGSFASNTATVTITVNAVNDVPVASGGSITTNEDTPSSAFALTGSDTDNDSLTFEIVTAPVKGTYNAATGIYTPNANANGSDSFTFIARDAVSQSAAATVSITVNPVNDAPTAASQSVTTDEDTAKAITLSGSDVDGDALTYNASQPSHGSVSCTGASCIYTPTANYNGSDSFTFKANDGQTDSAAATVSITVNPVNDNPDAINDPATVTEDSGANTVNVRGNDSISPDTGETLTVTAVTQGANGSVAVTSGGADVSYTPAGNYFGADSFTYTISDGNGGIASATVNVNITPLNDAPTALGNSYSVNEDTGLNISAPGVLANDSDVENDPLTALLVSAPANAASFSLNPNGSFTYTPAANFNGSDSFTYKARDSQNADSVAVTVSLTVNAINDRPAFASGGSVTSPEDTPYNAPWASGISPGAANESGQTLAFTVTGNTNAGLFSVAPLVAPNGTLSFTPALNASGSAQITVLLKDDGGTANGGADTSLTVTFTITITSVNDAPTVTVIPGAGCSVEPSGVMNLILADVDSPIDNLTLGGSSSNTALVPKVQILFGSSREYRIVLIGAQSRTTVQSAIVTLTVGDGQGGTSSTTIRVIVGTNAAQTITGTDGVDMIFGLNGNDTINAGGGIDLVCGGNGNDTLNGGAGDDTLDGENGDDLLRGEAGNDSLFGGVGNDRLEGGADNDTLTGGAGADYFIGGAGIDTPTDFIWGEDSGDGGVGLLETAVNRTEEQTEE